MIMARQAKGTTGLPGCIVADATHDCSVPRTRTATTPGDSIVLDEWQWVGLSYRHTEPVLEPVFYIDVPAIDTAIPGVGTGPAVDSSAPFTIGALAAGQDRFFAGIIDEFRIAEEIRDESWVAYEHASVASQLVELGAEEAW
jgi:hypothetical protein